MRPGGQVRIHPYALAKMRGDPRFIENAAPEVRARLLQLWRGSTVAALSTEQLEGQLKTMGTGYDRAAFVAQIPHHDSAWDLGEAWGHRLGSVTPADQEFLGLAACELWRRLGPQHPSIEMVDDWMCEGFELVEQKKATEALQSWAKVWDYVRPRLTPEMRDLSSAGDALFPMMSQCLLNWSVEFRLECVNASIHDPAVGHLGIRFCRELRAALPDEDEDLNISGDLAMLLFHVGADAEGERTCQEMIARRPDHPSGYIHWSDELVRRFSRGKADPAAVQQAIDLLERALAYPVKEAEHWSLPARLAEARKLLSTSGAR